MEKVEIFKDVEQINAELQAPRAEAAKIQRLLDLIGEVKAPKGTLPAKTGMDLVKDLVAGNIGTGYLQSVMVVRKGEVVLQDAIAKAAADCNGRTQDLERFILNEAGRVEPIHEQKVIAENTFYLENETQAEYIALAQSLADAWNALETYLADRKLPSIASNITLQYNTQRLNYATREAAGYYTLTANLKAVNDLK